MFNIGSLMRILINTNLYFGSLLIILTLRCIITQETLNLIFFEKNADKALTSESIFLESYLCLDSLDGKYKKYYRISNCKILETFVIDMDAFPLKFPTESRFGEKNDQNLYISANIITFEEFFYFYKTILEFPYLIDNINEEKYLLFIKILNIFKFERNSSFKNLIRFIWCSIIFNSVPIKERNFTSKKLQNYDLPKYIDLSKMVLVEILEIFKFSKEAISIIKDISWAKSVTKYYKFDFININDKFLYFDTNIIREFLTRESILNNIFTIIDIFNQIHTFKHYFLSSISYTNDLSKFFMLSFFKGIDEIYVAFSSNTDEIIEKICQTSALKNIKILNIIHSEFNTKDEIIFLKKYNIEKINYIVSPNAPKTYFHNSAIQSSVHDIYSKFIYEISENDIKVFAYQNRKLNKNIRKNFILVFYHNESIIEKVENLNSLSSMFLSVKLYNEHFWFKFFSYNLKEIKNIDVRFTDTYIKDFKLNNIEIFNKIIHIFIINSKLTATFLSRILLFPFLREVNISDSKVIFSNTQQSWIDNSSIQKFTLKNTSIDNQDLFIIFLNKITDMKNLKYSRSETIIFSNIFISCLNDPILNPTNLNSLKYYISYYSKRSIPFFPMFFHLKKFNFGFDYPEGTLLQIFLSQECNNLQKLKIFGVYIGKKDKKALGKCTTLNYLNISNTCRFDEIDFCELFDSRQNYIINELHLPNIELSNCDLIFFSKLKSLKKLYINSFKLKGSFNLILQSFRHVNNFEVGRILVSKEEISKLYEEFGMRIKSAVFNH
ncbi:hypothetical protein CWI39_0072p0020 [Hamiltosporidium magnivora]|uniref:Uncharacterized protein n=2 Tax=Hamiltosporidium magnivora TaxID=148818 RepID=A0A4Q9LNA4_9MICR|nr:hypothetical protein CWI39_0072p0020 [Hamiltosporidium magnivora]